MIMDKFLQFTGGSGGAPSNGDGLNDAITTAVTLTASSQILDLAIIQPALPPSQTSPYPYPFRDIGIGDDPAMKVLIQTTNAWTGGTSLQVFLQAAPDNGSGGTGTFVTWYNTPIIVAASLTAGVRLMDMDVPRPPMLASGGANPIPRFFQLAYTSVGTFSPAGLLRGAFVLDRFDQIYNANANNVLGGYAPGVVVAN